MVGPIEVARCRHCGHGVSLPRLDDVSFLYAGRGTQDYQPDARGLSALIKAFAFRRQARKVVRQLPEPPATLLDFGCGSGQFTEVLGQELCAGAVFGSDFHDAPPAHLSGDHYLAMSELDGRRFDAVIAMHVLEHDDQPERVLTKLKGLVKPGGALLVEVPNADCIWARLLGKKWDAWYVPYHRTHFTRRSLMHHLRANGLTVLAVGGETVPTMGRTLANCFGSSNNLFWLLCGIALHPLQWIGEKLSGEPSAIRVVARVESI